MCVGGGGGPWGKPWLFEGWSVGWVQWSGFISLLQKPDAGVCGKSVKTGVGCEQSTWGTQSFFRVSCGENC